MEVSVGIVLFNGLQTPSQTLETLIDRLVQADSQARQVDPQGNRRAIPGHFARSGQQCKHWEGRKHRSGGSKKVPQSRELQFINHVGKVTAASLSLALLCEVEN